MNADQQNAVDILTRAGRYLFASRNLRREAGNLTALNAAHHADPDVQAFAVLSVLIYRIVGRKHDGWVTKIERTLNLPADYFDCPSCGRHYEGNDATALREQQSKTGFCCDICKENALPEVR